MAKITALPEAAAVDGTETLPIVQVGETCRLPLKALLAAIIAKLPAEILSAAMAAEATYAIVAGDITLDANKRYAIDTTAPRSLTLPALSNVTVGQVIGILDLSGRADNNTITVHAAPGDQIVGGDGGGTLLTIYRAGARGEIVAGPDGWHFVF